MPPASKPTWLLILFWMLGSLAMATLGYAVLRAVFGPDFTASGFGLSATIGLTSGSAVLVGMMFASQEGWSRADLFPVGSSRGGAAVAAIVGAYPLGILGDGLSRLVQALLEDVWDAAPPAANIDLIVSTLTEGPLIERAVFALMVALVGPVLEELIFRGFLWRAVDGDRRPLRAVALTSVLFALFHGEISQGVGTLPLGAFLCLLRWRTGSLRLCFAAHCVNNTAAVVLVTAGAWGTSASNWELALSALVGLGAFAWVTRRVR